jgi:hypothetical protein
MLHAASAYQERKVPYIGFLWASLLFRPDLSLDYAHVLLRLADRVSYRQLQVIAFLAENASAGFKPSGRRKVIGRSATAWL